VPVTQRLPGRARLRAGLHRARATPGMSARATPGLYITTATT
jgi:hypothetical protein